MKRTYNYQLPNLPERTVKPRESGMTMVMDKGLSLREVEDFLSNTSVYVDLIKLGFGTSIITPNLQEKINLYREAGIPVYLGGTLFEAFVVRGLLDDYMKMLDKFGITHAEVSDGSIEIPEETKCEYINKLSKNFTVLSEVGSKDADKIIPPYKWIAMMKAELDAGAWKVIAEARESGTVGIFRKSGEVRSGLVEEILTQIPQEKIIWEAPQKVQQVWFIELYGHNVSLGNIAPNEVIPLETLRLGLRGDTFNFFLKK
ncbi:MAG: phosphosulfolactate synthase [Flavobacteriales bacterium]|nr:phosphosulfolactate synthase [Bacteroidota bacterium]MCB9240207.1 phosphosulfolactate synthase [Flavobacteriales bacterium]